MLCLKYNIVSVTMLQLLLLLSSLKTKITFNKIVPFHQQKLLTLTFMNGYVFEKIMKKKKNFLNLINDTAAVFTNTHSNCIGFLRTYTTIIVCHHYEALTWHTVICKQSVV